MSHALMDALYDSLGAECIDFAGFDDGKANVSVVVVVGEAGEGGPDAGVDVCVVAEQAFVGGVVEVRAVVYGGLEGGGAAEDFGLPGVEVAVEVCEKGQQARFSLLINCSKAYE